MPTCRKYKIKKLNLNQVNKEHLLSYSVRWRKFQFKKLIQSNLITIELIFKSLLQSNQITDQMIKSLINEYYPNLAFSIKFRNQIRIKYKYTISIKSRKQFNSTKKN